MQVSSFGTGARVKLPGESEKRPNVYDFGTSYLEMMNDLTSKSEEFYKKRGLIQMLQRNAGVKQGPERWQTTA